MKFIFRLLSALQIKLYLNMITFVNLHAAYDHFILQNKT